MKEETAQQRVPKTMHLDLASTDDGMSGDDQFKDHRVERFGALLAACHGDLFGFIYSLVQHHADAEDVYQQVAIVLWEKFDTFELGTNFPAWATTVAHNVARDFLRSRKRVAITFSEEVLDAIAEVHKAKRTSNSDVADALTTCVKKLSDRDRKLVDRCYAPNRDFGTIAKEEGRTIGAIYQAISRVRKSLHACVQRTLSQEGI